MTSTVASRLLVADFGSRLPHQPRQAGGARTEPNVPTLRGMAYRHSMKDRMPAAAVLLVAAALAACGSGSKDVVRTPTAPASSATTPSSSSSAPSTRPAGKPSATVTPASGLRDQQVVLVKASGFTPGEALQVIECADKGTKTGPGDCNLTGMSPVTSDDAGNVQVQLKVLRGPFGGNKIVCGASQRCLISVTQVSLAPTEEADAAIAFAAG
jgi:hypothetical protein